jgi:methyltransferase (TIGR00027 family)
VSERVASSTAVRVCQGRATADGRYAVDRFGDPIAWELLDPAERVIVDDVREGRVPRAVADRMAYAFVRHTGLVMVPRTLAIDDVIRQHAATQVVILGAGLDARAWRMPELSGATVFEVDHPASQADKRRRIGDLVPLAGRVAWVMVDLAGEPLGAALDSAGFDRQVVTTWVWEGVVPYLSVPEVTATLAEIAALCAPGSRIVVNYQARSLWVSVMRRVERLVLRLTGASDPHAGEPWRSLWAPQRLRSMLNSHGFDVVSDHDLLALSEGLALSSAANGSLRNGRVAVAVHP